MGELGPVLVGLRGTRVPIPSPTSIFIDSTENGGPKTIKIVKTSKEHVVAARVIQRWCRSVFAKKEEAKKSSIYQVKAAMSRLGETEDSWEFQ